eukprot:m.140704 g.140704  ORF g.140704 m.140704 type:complete len:555 (+) comp11534_c0_seq3:67-1731(+)
MGEPAVETEVYAPLQPDVTLRCGCGVELSDEYLYWCKYCVELKCRSCVSQEIDSFFDTKNADEHMPSIEANTARNRSTAGTMDCPVCPNVLDYKPLPDDKGKMFLECGHCLWSSHGPGSINLTGTVDEIKTAVADKMKGSYATLYDELIEQYQVVARDELRNLEAKRHNASQALQRRIAGRGLYSKYSYKRDGVQLTRKQYRAKEAERRTRVYDETKNEWVEATDTTKREALKATSGRDVEPLDVAALMAMTSIEDSTSLEQRLRNVAVQPAQTALAWPVPHRLLGKRSKRCRECQHNLIKPELSAKSTRYKMQLFATSHVPQVRVVEVSKLHTGVQGHVVLKLSNPVDQELHVTLQPAVPPSELRAAKQAAKTAEADAAKKSEAEAAGADGEGGGGAASAAGGGSAAAAPSAATPLRAGTARERDTTEYKLPAQTTEVRSEPLMVPNADLVLPGEPLRLPAHDPLVALSADEVGPDEGDDPCVIKRQGNKMTIKLAITPNGPEDADIVAAFDMKYKYKNVTAAFRSTQGADKAGNEHIVTIPVQIGLNKPLSQ